MRLAFECEDVCANPVEEEAVVGDDHGAACEGCQGVFQSAECFYVEVVCWLIKEQDVAA